MDRYKSKNAFVALFVALFVFALISGSVSLSPGQMDSSLKKTAVSRYHSFFSRDTGFARSFKTNITSSLSLQHALHDSLGPHKNSRTQQKQRQQEQQLQQQILSSFLVVIMIPVRFERLERDVMRETWLQYNNVYHRERRPKGTFRPFFLIGAEGMSEAELAVLTTEQGEHNDLWIDSAYPGRDSGTKLMGFMNWLVHDSNISFQALLKVDVDTFVRTEFYEMKVKDLIANKQNSSEKKPFIYGANWHVDARVCGEHRDKLQFNAGACWLVDSEIVRWWASASVFPEDVKWCSDIEDLRSGLWINQYMSLNNQPVTWVQASFGVELTEVLREYGGEQTIVFHFYQAKAHLVEYHRYLFKHFPPGSDFEAGEGWDWNRWQHMVNVNEIRRIAMNFPRRPPENEWLVETLAKYAERHERIPGIVLVGICPASTNTSTASSSLAVSSSLDITRFWKAVIQLAFPNATIFFFPLKGGGQLLDNGVKFDFVICEGFTYNSSIFSHAKTKMNERPFLISHNLDGKTAEKNVIDFSLQFRNSSEAQDSSSSIFFVDRNLSFFNSVLSHRPAVIKKNHHNHFGFFNADQAKCSANEVVSQTFIHALSGKYVAVEGKCKESVNNPKPIDLEDLIVVLEDYKFVFIPLPSAHQTDQIFLALLAQTVPIIFGATHEIDGLFDKRKFLTFAMEVDWTKKVDEIVNQHSGDVEASFGDVENFLSEPFKQLKSKVEWLDSQNAEYLKLVTGSFLPPSALHELTRVADELTRRLRATHSYLFS